MMVSHKSDNSLEKNFAGMKESRSGNIAGLNHGIVLSCCVILFSIALLWAFFKDREQKIMAIIIGMSS